MKIALYRRNHKRPKQTGVRMFAWLKSRRQHRNEIMRAFLKDPKWNKPSITQQLGIGPGATLRWFVEFENMGWIKKASTPYDGVLEITPAGRDHFQRVIDDVDRKAEHGLG